MVGHTHEDIDQLFSRFSVRASREDIFIMDDLITTFEKCYKQLPVTGMKIAEVYNFQEWLQLNNIKNHSHPHVFKFTRNEDGKAIMKYKKWSTDKKWITSTGSDKYILQDMDDSPINKIKPTVDNLDFERLRHDTDQVARITTLTGDNVSVTPRELD
ncbi:uncharacterized protein LOC132720949 [Ruditapes philippinarum]|uniref:uncharacterized protein LOC132720949 n=1 Tax=Ruditapes philippinarum TaxID=129788 RepID=UPI00295C30D5|nr:uncharacterized protein LOC132720949 [Ruditapes philippinarum]